MSRSKGYKCYNISCNSCLGKSLCTEPGEAPLNCVDRVVCVPRWEKDTPMGYRCSVCGCLMLDKSNYCPNCGSDMRGESGSEEKILHQI